MESATVIQDDGATEPERLLMAWSTAPDEAAGARIARALLENRLVACVNLLPGVRSLYRWQGELVDEPECLMLMKTSTRHWAALQQALPRLHPYEIPELLAVDPVAGAPAYVRWVLDAMKKVEPDASGGESGPVA